MYTFIILLCFLPILANCDETLHDGPCPKPPPAEQASKFVEIVGTWKATLDNYEELKKKPTDCAIYELTPIANTNKVFYKQLNKQYQTDQTLVPNKDFTEWYTTALNKTTGKYDKDGWVHTVVKIEGEGKDKGILKYACKNEGKQHRSFYRILGRQIPPNVEVQKKLVTLYNVVGDGRKMFTINWANCD